MINLPSQEELNNTFKYNSETGDLFKLPFTDEMGRYQTRYSKSPIRNTLTNDGGKSYYRTKITGNRSDVLVHRIIFKMVYNLEPESIDHIDGNGLNNRLVNIRGCSHSENHKNVKRGANNTSGVTGVSRSRDKLRWRVRIRVGKNDVNLGEFKNFDDAVKVRRQAEIDHEYHVNHGSDRPL